MSISKLTRVVGVLTVIGSVVASTSLAAYAATLTTASISLGDPRPSQTTTYTVTASGWTTATAIGCIQVKFNTQANGAGTVPNTTTGTTATQTVASGTWTSSAATNGTVQLTNSTPIAPADALAHTITMPSIVNGSTSNTAYYAIITTYTTNACSTPVDTTTVQFVYTDGQAATVSVDPTLAFSVASVASGQTVNGATTNVATTTTSVPFGTATIGANKIGAQSLSVTTNAGTGYTVYTRYSGQLNNGNGGTIADLSGATNAAPTAFTAAGTEAFGYTTEDTTLGSGTANRFSGGKWAAYTTTNQEVAYNAAPVSSDVTKVGYQVGVSGTTKAGTYNTTVIYTATPIY